jgi:hypothetical protein
MYLFAYALNSALGGYWLRPERDGDHRFAPELGGLSLTDAIMWQPRFGCCALGHLDGAGLLFMPLIQLDQRCFHKTHYLTEPSYSRWIEQLPRSKVHPVFREDFDEYNRTNHTAPGN